MKINIHDLIALFKRLPKPEYKGQSYYIPLYDRCAEINKYIPAEEDASPVDIIKIVFIAERYAERERTWLEWELLVAE